MATAVQDRLTLTVEECKQFARIAEANTSHDADIAALIEEAKERADQVLNDDFLDDSGDPITLPPRIKNWCKRFVVWALDYRGLRVSSVAIPGLGTQNWREGDWRMYQDLLGIRKVPGLGAP